jgi:peptidoglycan/LPS O-acetylase OafA/YrhL
VAIFFVHTSYVLMRTLSRLPEQDRAARFYVRRAFRIYPLSVLTVLVVVAGQIPPFPTRAYHWPGWVDLLSNLALVQNLTLSPSVLDPLWSLPYEVQMYLVLPALFLLVTRRDAPAAIWIWLAAVALALLQEQTIASRLDLARYAPCFVAGVVAFAQERRTTPRFGWTGWPVVIAAAFAFRQIGLEAGWVGCLLLGMTVTRFRQVRPAWIRRPAEWIARYSYGIYLAHLLVFWVAFVQLGAAPLAVRIAVCLVLSVLVPVGLYHGVEAPMIARGAALAGRLGRAQLSVAR